MRKISGNVSLFLILFCCFIILFFADLFIGSVNIPVKAILKYLFTGESISSEWAVIIREFRIPKAIVAILTGFALSISGLQMQTIFRNPLAGPFVLGISSGASLGVAVLMLGISALGIHHFEQLNNWTVVMAAWIGSGAILMIILAVSARLRDIMTILILGIMFSSVASALIGILQYFSNEAMLKSFMIWTMGSLSNITNKQLNIMVPGIIGGLILSVLTIKQLNALLMGENYARSLGIHVKRARFIIFISTSILAGTITAFCGPIGFVGIAVPHVARLLGNTSDHKILFWSAALIGAIMMLFSDIISQLPGSERNIPINTVTSLCGIPIVIWVVLKNRKFSSP